LAESDDLTALRDSCTRFVAGHGPARSSTLLETIPPDTKMDTYGDGGAVADLEAEIIRLLDKPAAVYLPSGTMAQQSVLRVHADRRGRRTVVFHPMCHLERHEEQGYQRLHGLIGRTAGNPHRLMTLDDLSAIAEPPAAVLIELPQRDLGGQQPAFDDLAALVAWAHEHGAAAHLDGARIWESAAGYERTPAEIAALFDTAYVSFYKGIGALPGCCVAGPEDVVAEVREWRRRMGGTLHGLWPGAASALTCLDRRLPRFPRYLEHARDIASALAGLPGVRVLPDPPQVPMMHLLLETSPDAYRTAARALASERATWVWPSSQPTTDPGVQKVELSVGDATCELKPDEIREIVAALVS
jgi:threonine aldolase